MKIKTASDLKYWHEQSVPSSVYFSRDTMKGSGDTMRNYGIRQPVAITTPSGDTVMAYELFRRRPVIGGNQRSAWFDATTFKIRHKKIEW